MSSQVEFQTTTPPLHWDEVGGIRVGRSRVTLDSVLASYQNGFTPEEIAVQYSVLNLADIYGAIAYYLSHRQQVDAYLEQRQQAAQQRRQQLAQEHHLSDLRQRLLARSKSR
ncbi:MAG: DUF433 domain-containing protein [Cyanobacteria bacterium P01_C01_bin.69]